MSRDPRMDMALAAGLLGMQDGSGIAGLFAVALVMHTLTPWREPTGRELERAKATARRFKLSEDLAIFLPPVPGALAGKARKEAYRGVVIALKRGDELTGDERTRVIEEIKMLLRGGMSAGQTSA